MAAATHHTERVAGPPVSPLPLVATVATVLGVAVVLVGVLGLAALALLVAPIGAERGLELLVGALALASVLALAVVRVALARRGASWRDLGFAPPTWRLLHLLWQFPLLLVLVLVVQVVFFVAVLGRDAPSGSQGGAFDEALAGLSPAYAVVLVLTVTVVTPLWEEAVFRGLVHGGLRRRTGPTLAVLGSTVLFAAAHGVPPLVPYYVMMGLGFGLLYEFHRTLWAPVLAHAALNSLATAVIVLGT